MIKIYVDTIEQKKSILKESKYIHDFMEVVKYKDIKFDMANLDIVGSRARPIFFWA